MKLKTEKMNKSLPNIQTVNLTELNELIYTGAKLPRRIDKENTSEDTKEEKKKKKQKKQINTEIF